VKQTQTAQTKARTILAQQHPEELRELYLEEKKTAALPTDTKQSAANSRARGRAISALVKKYPIEYQTIYMACVQQGHPSRNPPRVKGDS
jgi:hypothetical protein